MGAAEAMLERILAMDREIVRLRARQEALRQRVWFALNNMIAGRVEGDGTWLVARDSMAELTELCRELGRGHD